MISQPFEDKKGVNRLKYIEKVVITILHSEVRKNWRNNLFGGRSIAVSKIYLLVQKSAIRHESGNRAAAA